MVVLLNRNEERGEELKVPHHARATSTRDGNMPRVTATCLIPDNKVLFFIIKKVFKEAVVEEDYISILWGAE